MEYIRSRSKLIYLFAAFIALYLYETVQISPSDPVITRYHLTILNAIVLSLAVAIPYIIIWIVALNGYLRLRNYARTIRSSADGRALLHLVYGLFWLVVWMPLNTLLASGMKYVVLHYPSFGQWAHLIQIYFAIIILSIGYVLLYKASREMIAVIKHNIPARVTVTKQAYYLVYSLLCAAYIYAIFHNSGGADNRVVSFLPDWGLLLTVIIPRLVMWFFGLQAVWNIYLYAKYVHGKIYKQTFRSLAVGLGLVSVSLILAGYISTIRTTIEGYSLEGLLAVIYLFLAIMSVGYVIIAVGAQKLRRIEDV